MGIPFAIEDAEITRIVHKHRGRSNGTHLWNTLTAVIAAACDITTDCHYAILDMHNARKLATLIPTVLQRNRELANAAATAARELADYGRSRAMAVTWICISKRLDNYVQPDRNVQGNPKKRSRRRSAQREEPNMEDEEI